MRKSRLPISCIIGGSVNLGIQAVSVSYWDLYVMYIHVILRPKLMIAQEAVSLN